MGKGGKSKPGGYKLPPEKYVFVEGPWGNPRSTAFANNVGGWFRIMLDNEYPDTCINAIFTQSTHDDIIVELPEHVDVKPFLGAHIFANFLKPPYNESSQISNVYEYNYRRHNDPNKQWTLRIPNITDYPPPNFPVKDPYPSPSPAWNSVNKFALPLPGIPPTPLPISSTNTAIVDPHSGFASTVSQPSPLDTKQGINPSPQPISPDTNNSTTQVKVEAPDEWGNTKKPPVISDLPKVKKEEADETENLTVSIKKEQEEPHLDDYQPSSELLASFAALPSHMLSQPGINDIPDSSIKQEFIHTDGYKPSEELLTSFKKLPPHLLDPQSQLRNIKLENTHDNYTPSQQLAAIAKLQTQECVGLGDTPIQPVKEEPLDSRDRMAWQSAAVSHDPRIRAKAINQLEMETFDNNERVKRIKRE